MKKTKAFAAQVDLLRAILEWIGEDLSAWPPPLLRQIELACEEVIVNIIQHAYRGKPELFEIDVQVFPEDRVEIRFKDTGPPFDPTQYAYQPNTEKIGGLGIHFIRQTMNEVRYEREGDKNVLTLVKKWEITRSSRKK